MTCANANCDHRTLPGRDVCAKHFGGQWRERKPKNQPAALCSRCGKNPPRRERKLCRGCWSKQRSNETQYETVEDQRIKDVIEGSRLGLSAAAREHIANLAGYRRSREGDETGYRLVHGLIVDLQEQDVELRRLCERDHFEDRRILKRRMDLTFVQRRRAWRRIWPDLVQ